MKSHRRAQTAAEFLAELSADPAYRAAQASRDKRRAAIENNLAAAERPLLEALARSGVVVRSVRDLRNMTGSYAALLPTLLAALREPYPNKIREGIARSLAVPEALGVWSQLEAAFEAEQDGEVKWAIHGALAAAADRSVLDALVRLVSDRRHGQCRILLTYALGRMRDDDRARRILDELRNDPDIGTDADRALRGLKPRR